MSTPILKQGVWLWLQYIIGTAKVNGKRGPVSKLEKQIEQVQLLPRTKQQFVMEMLDTVIQQAAH